MQVSLNPTISQPRPNRPTFKAVIPKYVQEAQRQIVKYKQLDSILLRDLLEDVTLFKKVSVVDGIDTLNAIKKFTPNALNVIEYYLQLLKND